MCARRYARTVVVVFGGRTITPFRAQSSIPSFRRRRFYARVVPSVPPLRRIRSSVAQKRGRSPDRVALHDATLPRGARAGFCNTTYRCNRYWPVPLGRKKRHEKKTRPRYLSCFFYRPFALRRCTTRAPSRRNGTKRLRQANVSRFSSYWTVRRPRFHNRGGGSASSNPAQGLGRRPLELRENS